MQAPRAQGVTRRKFSLNKAEVDNGIIPKDRVALHGSLLLPPFLAVSAPLTLDITQS